MLLLALVMAPVMMLLASTIERRLGPAAGGWVAALPFALAATLVVVGVTDGPHVLSRLAASSAAHVPADIVFGVLGAAVLRRRGLSLGIAAAIGGYVATVALVPLIPAPVAIVIAALLLALAPLALPTPTPRGGQPTPSRPLVTALACGATVLAVLAAVLVTAHYGPSLGGAAAAYPAVTTILAIVVTTRDGRRRGADVLVGLTRSMTCYYAFAVTVAVSALNFGLAAVLIATPVAATAALLSAWQMRRSNRPTTPLSIAESTH